MLLFRVVYWSECWFRAWKHLKWFASKWIGRVSFLSRLKDVVWAINSLKDYMTKLTRLSAYILHIYCVKR